MFVLWVINFKHLTTALNPMPPSTVALPNVAQMALVAGDGLTGRGGGIRVDRKADIHSAKDK
jgi:hypothetical protein